MKRKLIMNKEKNILNFLKSFKHKKKDIYTPISTETLHVGALNDKPFSKPHDCIKKIFKKK